MNIREQIIAMYYEPALPDSHESAYNDGIKDAADLSEARERELLKELDDLMYDYNEISRDFAQLSLSLQQDPIAYLHRETGELAKGFEYAFDADNWIPLIRGDL